MLNENQGCKDCVYAGSFKNLKRQIKCKRYPPEIKKLWVWQDGWCGEWKSKNQYGFEQAILDDNVQSYLGAL